MAEVTSSDVSRERERTRRGIWIAAALGAPVLWLVMLETGYLVSHWSCGTGIGWPSHLVVGVAAIVLVAALWAMPRANASGHDTSAARLLAAMAFWLTAGFLLVVLASSIPAFILHPCD